MKKTTLFATALLAASHLLIAQTFNPAPGYTAAPVFTTEPGFTISGLSADTAGNLYYLQTGPFDGGPGDTRLLKRTAADNFANPIQLYTYGVSVSGNFVKTIGTAVYFGEGVGSGGTIRTVSQTGGASSLVVSLAGNYDLAAGISGVFVSANSSANPENKVYKLNLATGQLDKILDPTGDYSGALAVTSSGALLYGATVYGALGGGIYSVGASQIGSVTDADPPSSDTSLTLVGSSPLIANGNNQYLAYLDDEHLFQANSPFGSAGELKRFSLSTGFVGMVGTAGAATDFLGALAIHGSSLYSVVTADYFSGPSAVYVMMAVPEPATSMLVVIGSGWLLSRRRRRKLALL